MDDDPGPMSPFVTPAQTFHKVMLERDSGRVIRVITYGKERGPDGRTIQTRTVHEYRQADGWEYIVCAYGMPRAEAIRAAKRMWREARPRRVGDSPAH